MRLVKGLKVQSPGRKHVRFDSLVSDRLVAARELLRNLSDQWTGAIESRADLACQPCTGQRVPRDHRHCARRHHSHLRNAVFELNESGVGDHPVRRDDNGRPSRFVNTQRCYADGHVSSVALRATQKYGPRNALVPNGAEKLWWPRTEGWRLARR